VARVRTTGDHARRSHRQQLSIGPVEAGPRGRGVRRQTAVSGFSRSLVTEVVTGLLGTAGSERSPLVPAMGRSRSKTAGSGACGHRQPGGSASSNPTATAKGFGRKFWPRRTKLRTRRVLGCFWGRGGAVSVCWGVGAGLVVLLVTFWCCSVGFASRRDVLWACL